MRVPIHPTLIRRMLDSRLKKVQAAKPVLSASLFLIHKHCGRPGCHCLSGGPKHTAHHLSYKVGGRSRSIYVPLDLLKDVQLWIEENRRLKQLLREINQLTLALVRTHVQNRQRKRGRP